ncbi:hypothetical protein RYZ27_08450 [Hyphomonas sp. FCG-A18]|uniref:hypothetical protein n=1 Tax=Hyphomonas sp. FCG-A18 TaxID=3080019 RepID=UPI002B2A3A9F|nr:hypothetical protein RYZ27_08450 [Hyphomonas sp. FCG-A18]
MKYWKSMLACAAASAAINVSVHAENDLVTLEAINHYKALTVAEMVDDKCHQMPFVERALLVDAMIEAAHMLPPIAESVANGNDSQTYFTVWEQTTKPIREEVAVAVESFPCDNAHIAFGRARMLTYIDIVAHFQNGRETFLATASNREKANLSGIIDFVKQRFSTSQEGSFERAIAQRMQKIEYTGEDAANRTKYMLGLMFITQLLGDKEHDIRWQADSMTWGLYDIQKNRFVRGYHFEKPRLDYRFTVEGDTVLDRTYDKEPVVIIPGTRDKRITILALSTNPTAPLQNTEATIIMGTGIFGTYKSNPAYDCPVDACLEFSSLDTQVIRDRIERDNGEHSASFYLNEISENFGSITPKDLRQDQGLSPFQGPKLFLRDEFFDE